MDILINWCRFIVIYSVYKLNSTVKTQLRYPAKKADYESKKAKKLSPQDITYEKRNVPNSNSVKYNYISAHQNHVKTVYKKL